jgi:adenylate kinase family enzyme
MSTIEELYEIKRSLDKMEYELRMIRLNMRFADHTPEPEPKTLFIIRGVPGSGKSTFANKIMGSDFLVCEADKFFYDEEGNYNFDGSKLKDAHEWCRNRVETYMKDSLVNDQFYREIAVSNTFTREWEMQAYFDLAAKYGYRVYSIVVENRHNNINTHGVPEDKVEEMRNRFEIKL